MDYLDCLIFVLIFSAVGVIFGYKIGRIEGIKHQLRKETYDKSPIHDDGRFNTSELKQAKTELKEELKPPPDTGFLTSIAILLFIIVLLLIS